MRRFVDRVTDLVVMVIAGVIALSAALPLRDKLQTFREKRRVEGIVKSAWPTAIATGARLDQGSGEVQIVEFSDYQCPFCRQLNPSIDSLIAKHSEAGVVLRHLPLPIHPAAEGAARVSICAEKQGKFRAAHNYLFATTNWQIDTNWVTVGKNIGIADIPVFTRCLRSEETKLRLDADRALAEALELTGTPALLTKKTLTVGLLPSTTLEGLVAPSRDAPKAK